MKNRIFWYILASAFLAVLLASSLTAVIFRVNFNEVRERYVADRCELVAGAYDIYIDPENADQRRALPRDVRLVLLDGGGAVLYDSMTTIGAKIEGDIQTDTDEIMSDPVGGSVRYSTVFGSRTYYHTLKFGGDIISVSSPIDNHAGPINTSLLITVTFIVAFVCAAAATGVIIRAVISPINDLNLDNPLANNTYAELSPLLRRMDRQNRMLADQVGLMEQKQREFNDIIVSMSEALVVFGSDRHIMFTNNSADSLFGAPHEKNVWYLAYCRDMSYTRAVEAAFEGRAAGEKLIKDGRIYQLSVNPVSDNNNDNNDNNDNNNSYAAVLLAVDITEKEESEKMRREFSANVSHELKTPLTSISGYAEIMANGIAKREDHERFARQIHTEALGLISLVDDIIRLSRLDEGAIEREFQTIDLGALCEKVITSLSDKAAQAGVRFILRGGGYISGIEGILGEMIYNLCDNAVIYNKPGGSVTVSVGDSTLTVSDSGIGIAPEYQGRIFERFYRVDKSRSKNTGGTGLGLSIVKHAAALHGAEIKLDSRPGVGTTITVIFDKAESKMT